MWPEKEKGRLLGRACMSAQVNMDILIQKLQLYLSL